MDSRKKMEELLGYMQKTKKPSIQKLQAQLLSLPRDSFNKSEAELFMDCVSEYIDVVKNVASSKGYREQIKICRQAFRILHTVVADEIRTVFMENLTQKVFDVLLDEETNTWCIKKELLKTFAFCIYGSSKQVRLRVVEGLPDFYLFKIVDSISSYGDYDFQVTLIEVVFRMYGKSAILPKLTDLIPESQELSESFAQITGDTFDEDTRKFLNALNENAGKVFSVVCSSVFLGDRKCTKSIESVDGLWVDFNLPELAVSWYCLKECMVNSQEEANAEWLTLMFFVSDVESVRIYRPQHGTEVVVFIKLKTYCICSEDLKSVTEATDVKFVLPSASNKTTALLSKILPVMFKNKYQHNAAKVSLNMKSVYKPLHVSVSMKSKSDSSKSKSEVSFYTAQVDPGCAKSDTTASRTELNRSCSSTSSGKRDVITISDGSVRSFKDFEVQETQNTQSQYETAPMYLSPLEARASSTRLHNSAELSPCSSFSGEVRPSQESIKLLSGRCSGTKISQRSSTISTDKFVVKEVIRVSLSEHSETPQENVKVSTAKNKKQDVPRVSSVAKYLRVSSEVNSKKKKGVTRRGERRVLEELTLLNVLEYINGQSGNVRKPPSRNRTDTVEANKILGPENETGSIQFDDVLVKGNVEERVESQPVEEAGNTCTLEAEAQFEKENVQVPDLEAEIRTQEEKVTTSGLELEPGLEEEEIQPPDLDVEPLVEEEEIQPPDLEAEPLVEEEEVQAPDLEAEPGVEEEMQAPDLEIEPGLEGETVQTPDLEVEPTPEQEKIKTPDSKPIDNSKSCVVLLEQCGAPLKANAMKESQNSVGSSIVLKRKRVVRRISTSTYDGDESEVGSPMKRASTGSYGKSEVRFSKKIPSEEDDVFEETSLEKAGTPKKIAMKSSKVKSASKRRGKKPAVKCLKETSSRNDGSKSEVGFLKKTPSEQVGDASKENKRPFTEVQSEEASSRKHDERPEEESSKTLTSNLDAGAKAQANKASPTHDLDHKSETGSMKPPPSDSSAFSQDDKFGGPPSPTVTELNGDVWPYGLSEPLNCEEAFNKLKASEETSNYDKLTQEHVCDVDKSNVFQVQAQVHVDSTKEAKEPVVEVGNRTLLNNSLLSTTTGRKRRKLFDAKDLSYLENITTVDEDGVKAASPPPLAVKAVPAKKRATTRKKRVPDVLQPYNQTLPRSKKLKIVNPDATLNFEESTGNGSIHSGTFQAVLASFRKRINTSFSDIANSSIEKGYDKAGERAMKKGERRRGRNQVTTILRDLNVREERFHKEADTSYELRRRDGSVEENVPEQALGEDAYKNKVQPQKKINIISNIQIKPKCLEEEEERDIVPVPEGIRDQEISSWVERGKLDFTETAATRELRTFFKHMIPSFKSLFKIPCRGTREYKDAIIIYKILKKYNV